MMLRGHRERLIDGHEYDALTRGGKRAHRWRAGQRTSADATRPSVR
jgi:hypothetical protein